MKFELEKACQVLSRTPAVLKTLLAGIDDEWTKNNEGPETFSPYDVVGHLLHGERTDWPARVEMILQKGTTATFDLYDRFAMYEESKGKTLEQLLDEFEEVRAQKVDWLRSLGLNEIDLDKKGMHPTFGEVTLRQLLSTWVVHDLSHISQITRVMAKQYKDEVGPWSAFIRLLSY